MRSGEPERSGRVKVLLLWGARCLLTGLARVLGNSFWRIEHWRTRLKTRLDNELAAHAARKGGQP